MSYPESLGRSGSSVNGIKSPCFFEGEWILDIGDSSEALQPIYV